MTRFRAQISGLIVTFATLVAVGPLSVDHGVSDAGIIAFPMIVLLLAALTVFSPRIARVPLALSAGVVVAMYVAARANPLMADRDWTGWQPAVALIEIALSVSALVSARQVAAQLAEFEEAVANVTLGDLARVKSLEAAGEDIAIEMARARRHERPLTVTVLSAEAAGVHAALHRIVQDVQRAMMQRYIISGLARLAAQTTRRGDIVVQDAAHQRVIVVSPEATPTQVEHLAGRLQFTAAERLGLPVRYGSAGFPNHALTFEDLVSHASSMAGVIDVTPPTDEISERRRWRSWVAAGDRNTGSTDDNANTQRGDAPLADIAQGR